MLTARKVRAMVTTVRLYAKKGDFEAAHVQEDELMREVVRSIAVGGCEDPRACAAEAFKSTLVKFDRYAS